MSYATTQLSVFDVLDRLDLMFELGQHSEAMVLLTRLLPTLADMSITELTPRSSHHGDWQVDIREVAQRYVGFWRRLLSSPADLSRINTQELLPHLDVLHGLMLSTYEGCLDSYSIAQYTLLRGKFQPPELLKLVLAWCPESRLEWDPLSLMTTFPEVIAMQALACLAMAAPVSSAADQAQQRAIKLFASGAIDTALLTRTDSRRLLARAWQACAYCEHEQIDNVRELLRQAMERSVGLAAPSMTARPAEQRGGKSVMLVAIERGMLPTQVCALQSLLERADQFHCVAVVLDVNVSIEQFSCFDQIENLSAKGRAGHIFNALQDLVAAMRPDMLLLAESSRPIWRLLLGARRLAPRQLALSTEVRAAVLAEVDRLVVPDVGQRGELPASALPVPPSFFAASANETPLGSGQRAQHLAWQPAERLRVALLAQSGQLQNSTIDALRAFSQSSSDWWVPVVLFEGTALEVTAARSCLARQLVRFELQALANSSQISQQLAQTHVALCGLVSAADTLVGWALAHGMPHINGAQTYRNLDGWQQIISSLRASPDSLSGLAITEETLRTERLWPPVI